VATSASSRKAKPVTEPAKNNTDDKPTPIDPPAESKSTSPKHSGTEVSKETEAADVKALLSRHTFDGKGENAVPPENFRSFSTEGVEKGALKDPDVIAQEVLHGNWGPNADVVVERLTAAGYDQDRIDAIEREFNNRKLRGAPSAF